MQGTAGKRVTCLVLPIRTLLWETSEARGRLPGLIGMLLDCMPHHCIVQSNPIHECIDKWMAFLWTELHITSQMLFVMWIFRQLDAFLGYGPYAHIEV